MGAPRALVLLLGFSLFGHAAAGESLCGIGEFESEAECREWPELYEEALTCSPQYEAAGILVLGSGAFFQDFKVDNNFIATSNPNEQKQFRGASSVPYTCVVAKNIELSGLGNQNLDVNSLTLQAVTATFLDVHIADDYTGDDGIELFGSNVTVYRLTVTNAGDDSVDLDEGSYLAVNTKLVVQGTGSSVARADKKGAAVEMTSGAHLNVRRFEFTKPNTFNEGNWYFKEDAKDGVSIKMGTDTTYEFIESTTFASGDASATTQLCGIMVVDTAAKCRALTGTFTVRDGCIKATSIIIIGEGKFDDFFLDARGAAGATPVEIWATGRRFSCAMGDVVLDRLGDNAADMNSITFKGVDVTMNSLKVTDDGTGDDGVELFDSTVIILDVLEVSNAGDDFVDLDKKSKMDVRGELKITGANSGSAGVEMSGNSQFFAKRVTFDSEPASFGEGHFYVADKQDLLCPSGMVCASEVEVMASYVQPEASVVAAPPPSPSPGSVGTSDGALGRRSLALLPALLVLALAGPS